MEMVLGFIRPEFWFVALVFLAVFSTMCYVGHRGQESARDQRDHAPGCDCADVDN